MAWHITKKMHLVEVLPRIKKSVITGSKLPFWLLDDNFNAETGLFFKCIPDKTLKFKNEKGQGGKLSKERVVRGVTLY